MSNGINERKNKSCNCELNSIRVESYKELNFLLNKSATIISHSMGYYVIKYFVDNKIQSTNLKSLLNHIINIFNKNPENILTNTDEAFTSTKGIKTTFTKLINKNNFIKYNPYNNVCKLNELEAINYLKSQSIHYRRNRNVYKTPIKLSSKSQTLIPLEEKIKYLRSPQKQNIKMKIKTEEINESDDDKIIEKEKDEEKIKIKKEDISIKEENKKKNEEETIKIKKEVIKIKEEEKIKEENIDDDELKFDNIIESFNGKLYDEFYSYLSEPGLYEQLQEIIEKYLETIDKNKMSNENDENKDINEFINKIKIIKTSLDQLNENEKTYHKLIEEFKKKKKNLNLYMEILRLKNKEIKIAKEMLENEDPNICKIGQQTKELYYFDKKMHDKIYSQLLISHKEIKNLISNSKKVKDSIKKDFIDIFENNKFEDNTFRELIENFKNEKDSSFENEIAIESFFQKYNLFLKELDNKINGLFPE